MSSLPFSAGRAERLRRAVRLREGAHRKLRFVPVALALGVTVAVLTVPAYVRHAIHQDRAFLGASSRLVEDRVIVAEGIRPSVIAAVGRVLPRDARYRIVVSPQLGATQAGQAFKLWLAVRLLPRVQVPAAAEGSWLVVWSEPPPASLRTNAVLVGYPRAQGPPLYIVRVRG